MIEDLRAHRPEALDALLSTYGREIQAVAYLILRDRDAAEDITVETILSGWERAQGLRDPRALRAWLLKIAANKSLSYRRHTARVVPLRLVTEPGPVRDHGPDAVTRVALRSGVAELPPHMRAAVVLRYYADLSVNEVAAALGKSPNTIKAQLQVALDRLRGSLGDSSANDPVEVRHA